MKKPKPRRRPVEIPGGRVEVLAYVSPKEHEAIRLAAFKERLSMSAWLRNAALAALGKGK
jgi:hypothetical protein